MVLRVGDKPNCKWVNELVVSERCRRKKVGFQIYTNPGSRRLSNFVHHSSVSGASIIMFLRQSKQWSAIGTWVIDVVLHVGLNPIGKVTV